MTALARGVCPACGRIVALRKDALVREHRRQGAELNRYAPVCGGSGERAARVVTGGGNAS